VRSSAEIVYRECGRNALEMENGFRAAGAKAMECVDTRASRARGSRCIAHGPRTGRCVPGAQSGRLRVNKVHLDAIDGERRGKS
jgi:hypothetical protein